MAISYNQKVAVLDHLTTSVASQKAIVLLTTKNSNESLSANLNSQFRKEARQNGIVLKVVKNTIIQKAFTDVPTLEGPTYLAYLTPDIESDEIKVPKSIVPLVKNNFADNFNIVGSIVNGSFLDSEETISLSKTPSKEESMAKVAGGVNQLASKIAISINEIPSKIVRVVSAYSKTLN
jgi:large subunit ribosomal protein L10